MSLSAQCFNKMVALPLPLAKKTSLIPWFCYVNIYECKSVFIKAKWKYPFQLMEPLVNWANPEEQKQIKNITRMCFAYLGHMLLIGPVATTWHPCDYYVISESLTQVST
jgi:hypothetical protein